jgi:hypothetical protein
VVAGGLAADRRSDDADASIQDRPGVIVNPGLGGRVALGEEAPSGPPQVLQHVHEVDHDRYVHAACLGFGADPSELVVVAVDQRDPGAVLVGVATLGFVEHLADHPGRVPWSGGNEGVVVSLSDGSSWSLGRDELGGCPLLLLRSVAIIPDLGERGHRA